MRVYTCICLRLNSLQYVYDSLRPFSANKNRPTLAFTLSYVSFWWQLFNRPRPFVQLWANRTRRENCYQICSFFFLHPSQNKRPSWASRVPYNIRFVIQHTVLFTLKNQHKILVEIIIVLITIIIFIVIWLDYQLVSIRFLSASRTTFSDNVLFPWKISFVENKRGETAPKTKDWWISSPHRRHVVFASRHAYVHRQ